jgi:hypothetical protein
VGSSELFRRAFCGKFLVGVTSKLAGWSGVVTLSDVQGYFFAGGCALQHFTNEV